MSDDFGVEEYPTRIDLEPGDDIPRVLHNPSQPNSTAGVSFRCEADSEDDGLLYFSVERNGIEVATESFREAETSIWSDAIPEATICATVVDGAIVVSLSMRSGVEAYNQHLRERGALPELAPPAEGRQQAAGHPPNVPRQLDRRLDEEAVERFLDALSSEPFGYAVTFPYSDAPDTYIRALTNNCRVRERFALPYEHDWEYDADYVGVRAHEQTGEWALRKYDEAAVERRLGREPAVRLVHKEDTPEELYPEAYR